MATGAMVLTDQDIRDLLRLPKQIVGKTPAKGYKQEGGHKRCDLKIEVRHAEAGGDFEIFVRQNTRFIENFSLGLKFKPSDWKMQALVLVRYNGPHGETSRHPDGHYSKPHIHRLTATEISAGSTHPREKAREITEKYHTFEQAIGTFFQDVNVGNYSNYFPESLQGRML